ncbi:MAG: hypothetical protein ABI443_07415 [Chthoniobacterales bacterium]
MKRIALTIVFLLAFGALRAPYEIMLQDSEKSAQFRTVVLNLTLREQIGQTSFLAALSGFRSLIAAFLWIDAHIAWEKTEWGRMAGIFGIVTTLQPHSVLYWDMSAWHMAWNASVAAAEDKNQPSELLRKRAQHQYFDLGRSFLERGILNNPDKYYLYERLGALERDKYENHAAAAAAFAKAAALPDAPPYIRRFAAYELSKVPGKEKEAYHMLREIFDLGEIQRLPTLMKSLQEMEKKLDIPQDQRIQVPAPSREKK